VLAALAEWQAARRPPEGWLKRAFNFLTEHWPVLTFIATVLVATGAILWEGFSPLYPFKALAFSEKELSHREREFSEQKAAFGRAADERGLTATLTQNSVRLAKSFLDVGQLDEAKRAYEQALELDPLDLVARRGLFKTEVYGMAAAGQHDAEVIRMRLESLLAINAKDPHALTMLGNLYARAGLGREEAMAKYRQAIAIDPAVAEAHLGLATLYLKDADLLAQAQAPIEEAVRLSPWNRRYLETLANVRDQGGNVGEAFELYRRVLSLDGDYLSPYFEIVNLQRRLGDLARALVTGQRLAARLDDKRITDLPKNRKTLYFPAGDGTVSLHNVEQKRCYALLSLSATAYLLGRPDAARAYAAQARPAAFPDGAEVARLLASDLRRLKEDQPAIGARIDEYLAEYLQAPPSPKADPGD